jgi:hypothetical protein
LIAAFIPLVPEASCGRLGLFNKMSTPLVIRPPQRMS